MKRKMRNLLLAISVSLPFMLGAQPAPNSYGPGGGAHGLPSGGENKSAPLNGGTVMMLIMATALGAGRYAGTAFRKPSQLNESRIIEKKY